MKIEVTTKQQAVPALIISMIALILAVFLVLENEAFRSTSVAVPGEYVGGVGWNWADLRFKRNGQQVVEGVRGYFPLFSKGDAVPVRLLRAGKAVRADNFLTNWVFVIGLGWISLSFGYIGIASLLAQGKEDE